jgi:pimeloyl-ACP methyl ester carboxylesterase
MLEQSTRALPLLLSCIVSSGLAAQVPRQSASRVLFEETHVTTADGVRLYVRIVGSGPDTVVIGSAAYLARDLAPLAEGRTLIFYDPRGRGGSDAVLAASRLGMDFEVADLEAVRSHFGVDRVSLVGWSYLGAVVALYAAKYPEHVRAVVQIGPMAPRRATLQGLAPVSAEPDPADAAHLAELRQSGVADADPVRYCREFVLRQMLRPMMVRREAAVLSRADPCTHWNEWPAQVFATMSKFIPPVTGADWDYSAEARRVRVPVLIVHGTADPNAAVEGGRDWASLFPNAEIVELPGVGHGPWVEAPAEFFPAIDRFLRSCGRTAASGRCQPPSGRAPRQQEER